MRVPNVGHLNGNFTGYRAMPSMAQALLAAGYHRSPEQEFALRMHVTQPTMGAYARARELALEPMALDARPTGAEGRAAYPFHAEVAGLGAVDSGLTLL